MNYATESNQNWPLYHKMECFNQASTHQNDSLILMLEVCLTFEQATIPPIHTCHQSCWDHPGSTHKYCNLGISKTVRSNIIQYPPPWAPVNKKLLWNPTELLNLRMKFRMKIEIPWLQQSNLVLNIIQINPEHVLCKRNRSWHINVMHHIYRETKETTTPIIFIYEKVSVKDLTVMSFWVIYQSWVKDPIDPTRLTRRRTLEWTQERLKEKIGTFGVMGWIYIDYYSFTMEKI